MQQRFLYFLFLSLALAIGAGCGSSFNEVTTSGGNGSVPSSSITINHVLAREVPSSVTTFSISGFNATNAIVYGPQQFPKTASLTISVPVTLTRLRIDYLEGTTTVGRYETEDLDLVAGGTLTINDPPFVDLDDEPGGNTTGGDTTSGGTAGDNTTAGTNTGGNTTTDGTGGNTTDGTSGGGTTGGGTIGNPPFFPINFEVSLGANRPAVAMDSGSKIVVSYDKNNNNGVEAQILDAGNFDANPSRVRTIAVAADGLNKDIAMASNGDFVSAYQQLPGGNPDRIRSFDFNGDPLSAGVAVNEDPDPMDIDLADTDTQLPLVLVNRDSPNMFFQRFAQDVTGGPGRQLVPVNTTSYGGAVTPDGTRGVVAWTTEARLFPDRVDTETSFFYAQFNADGTLGASGALRPSTTGSHRGFAIDMYPDGTAVVVYQVEGVIYASIIPVGSAPTEVALHQGVFSDSSIDVAVQGTTGFILSFSDFSLSRAVHVQRHSRDGTLLGEARGFGQNVLTCRVASNAAGDYAVVQSVGGRTICSTFSRDFP